MQIVMCNIFQCPFCQFCVFEDDCTRENKFDARKESERGGKNIEYFEPPTCFEAGELLQEVEK